MSYTLPTALLTSLVTLVAPTLGQATDAPFVCGTTGPDATVPRGVLPCFHELPNRVESDHFSVQWGSNGGTSEAAAQGLLDELEFARQVYLDSGYSEPAGVADGYRVPFYLGNSGPGAPGINFSGGYTTMCGSYQHAYVVMSSIEQTNSTLDVANHELFHAVQMGSPDAYNVDGFYWESSATWAEDLVEPDFNIYQWFLPSYTNHTEWALDYEGQGSNDAFLHRYAMFILPSFIDEHSPSGPEVLVQVWSGPGASLSEKLNLAWQGLAHDTDFDREFGRFTAHVAVMDFEDHQVYEPYAVPPRETLQPPAQVDGSPQRYGSHFYRVDPSSSDVDDGHTKLRVVLEGGSDDWIVAISRSPEGLTALPTVVVADDDGHAVAKAIDVGTLYDETWVIVTSTSSNGSYTMDVELVEQTEPPGSDIDPPEGDDDDDDRPGLPGAGCKGADVHPFSYQGLTLSLLLLFAPILRRTR